MIADTSFWDLTYTEEVFTSGVFAIMRLIIPLSICLGIWLHYYNRSTSFTGLGLDEASTVSKTQTLVWPWRILYTFALTITFLIGLLTFRVWQLTQQLISALLQ